MAATLVIAVVWDLRVRRIPNLLSGAAALAGLLGAYGDGGFLALLSGLGAGAATIAALFTFWRRGGLGGGDVKFAGAVAMWVGLSGLPVFWLATAVAGGATAAICLLASRAPARLEMRANLTIAALHQVIPSVSPATAGRVSVPYGVAIALGAAFLYCHRLG
ncbi:MAG TPA: A24 family peptidase [Polyangia bacterium]